MINKIIYFGKVYYRLKFYFKEYDVSMIVDDFFMIILSFYMIIYEWFIDICVFIYMRIDIRICVDKNI